MMTASMKSLLSALLVLFLVISTVGPSFAQQADATDPMPTGESTLSAEGDAAEEALPARALKDWYAMGGWVMHGLVFLSALALALIFERMLALRRGRIIPRKFMSSVMEHWSKGDLGQVVRISGDADNSMARMLRSGLIHFDEGLARVEDAVSAAADHEASLLRRNLPVLAAIGNIATMLGLLGTVIGMIASFEIIAETGTGDAREVAGGIFQALVTTAAGLMVGITAIAAHSYLRRKAEALEIELQETSIRMLEDLSVGRREPDAPVTTASRDLTPQEA